MEGSFATGDLLKCYNAILEACKEIAEHLRYNTSHKIGTQNDFGDNQLDMDVQTDSIMFEHLGSSGVVHSGLSEERSYITKLNDEGKYVVAFDPLDGSSIVDTNFTVGTICGIYPTGELKDMNGHD